MHVTVNRFKVSVASVRLISNLSRTIARNTPGRTGQGAAHVPC